MQITLTGEEVLILFFLVISLYGLGWLVVNKIIPGFIRRRAKERREEQKKKDKEDT